MSAQCFYQAFSTQQVIVGVVLFYILILPFTIIAWKHTRDRDRWFKTHDKYQKGKIKW